MAQVSFDVASTMEQERGQYNNDVEFLNLPNDGDEAIVRFLYDNTSQFNIMTVHEVKLNNKFRKVNCIREPQDPIHVCPLCASGNNIKNSFFIHMLVYKKDAQGNITPVPTIWERGFSYATRLKRLLDEYGPLTGELFKIKRNGARGSMDTTYDIMYCSPKVYTPEVYPLIDNPFGNWKELGTIVLNKDDVAMNTFIQTGVFPTAQDNSNTPTPVPAPTPVQPEYVPKAEVNQAPTPTYTAPAPIQPAQTTTAPAAPSDLPWMNPSVTSAAPARPTRYY